MEPLRAILATRDFRYLYGTRLSGQFGDGLLQAALATFVLFSPERAPNAVTVAASFAILLLPYSIIGPFAGVFLDRWDRRNVLVRANALKALLTVPIIAAFLAGDSGFLLGVLVLSVLGVGRFILAGLSASLPHVVSGRNLITANALTPTSGTIATAIGGVVGVALRTAVGGGDDGSIVVLIFAIGSYLSSGFIASRIARRRLGPTDDVVADTFADVLRGLRAGAVQLFRATDAARATAAVGAHRIALGALTVGGLLLLRNTFNPATEADTALGQFALLTGTAAAGALIAAILTPGMSRRFGRVPWSVFALAQGALIGVPAFVFASAIPAYAPLFVAAFSIGFTGQAVKVSADTAIQQSIPDDYLGRVFALFDMIVNVTMVTGVFLVALLAPASGQAPWLYAVTGVLLLVTAVWLRGRPRHY